MLIETAQSDIEVLATGLCFGEGPRWRDNTLVFSDMHDRKVLSLTATGTLSELLRLDDEPSGLGWLPNGDLLVVSMTERSLLRVSGDGVSIHADLSGLADFHCNDLLVDPDGRAYVGNFGFDLHNQAAPKTTGLIAVEPDGAARLVADDLMFPNGMVLTPDRHTLVVAESFAGRLTAFDVAPNGDLSNRRLWAQLPEGAVPDGICLDSGGGIWAASPSSNDVLRLLEGGEVSHRAAMDRGAFACMLGGEHLYVLTAADSHPDKARTARSGQVVRVPAPYPRAGWP